MADPSRRAQDRFPSELEGLLVTPTSGARIAAIRITDVSMGGAAVETGVPLSRGVPYDLEVVAGAATLRLPARVAWEAKPDAKSKTRRYGLSFTLTRSMETLWTAVVEDARQRAWGG